MANGMQVKDFAVLIVLILMGVFIIWLAESKVRMEDSSEGYLTIPFAKGDSLIVIPIDTRYRDKPLWSIETIEQNLGIEVLIPTVRELQLWCVRKDVNMPTKGYWGPITKDGIYSIRCIQEASRWSYVFELGEPNEKEVQRMYIQITE